MCRGGDIESWPRASRGACSCVRHWTSSLIRAWGSQILQQHLHLPRPQAGPPRHRHLEQRNVDPQLALQGHRGWGLSRLFSASRESGRADTKRSNPIQSASLRRRASSPASKFQFRLWLVRIPPVRIPILEPAGSFRLSARDEQGLTGFAEPSNKKATISSREIQTAVRLIFPGECKLFSSHSLPSLQCTDKMLFYEVAKHAISEGTKAGEYSAVRSKVDRF